MTTHKEGWLKLKGAEKALPVTWDEPYTTTNGRRIFKFTNRDGETTIKEVAESEIASLDYKE